MAEQALRMLRPKKIWERLGKSRSSGYVDISNGLMVSLVSIGPRAKAAPEHEVDAINAARIAGKSDDEIRALVKRLEAARGGS